MKNNTHFKKFVGTIISLNPTREDKINSAYETWKKKLKENDKIKDRFIDFFQQGSYSTKTAIKPQDQGEFDVDAVLLLDIEEDQKPKQLIDEIKGIIKENKGYTVKPKERCIRIEYANEFHMDIVPAKKCGEDHIFIPCKSTDEWQETNPVGFTKWFKEQHSDSNYMLQNVVKILKYWRDTKVGEETAPKSILLTTLVAIYFKGANSIAESLVLTLENLNNNIDEILDSNGEPYVENPSLDKENLARDWDRGKFDIFAKKLDNLTRKAREALDSDKEHSIDNWKEIFDKFPDTVEESEKAKDISEMCVTTIGTLSKNNGIPIPSHRFYGGRI